MDKNQDQRTITLCPSKYLRPGKPLEKLVGAKTIRTGKLIKLKPIAVVRLYWQRSAGLPNLDDARYQVEGVIHAPVTHPLEIGRKNLYRPDDITRLFGKEYPDYSQAIIIGKNSKCDLRAARVDDEHVLDADLTISGYHCLISYQGDGVFITDIGTNGIYMDGKLTRTFDADKKPIRTTIPWKQGSRVEIGDLVSTGSTRQRSAMLDYIPPEEMTRAARKVNPAPDPVNEAIQITDYLNGLAKAAAAHP